MPTPWREHVSIYGLLRDGSTVRPAGAVPLRCHAITLVLPLPIRCCPMWGVVGHALS